MLADGRTRLIGELYHNEALGEELGHLSDEMIRQGEQFTKEQQAVFSDPMSALHDEGLIRVVSTLAFRNEGRHFYVDIYKSLTEAQYKELKSIVNKIEPDKLHWGYFINPQTAGEGSSTSSAEMLNKLRSL